MNVQSFTPAQNKTISASTSSASQSFTGGAITTTQVMISNETTSTAYVRWGVGAQTAVNTDTPVLGGTVQIFNKGLADTVAVILATGSGNVYITAGEGQ